MVHFPVLLRWAVGTLVFDMVRCIKREAFVRTVRACVIYDLLG